MNFKKIIDWIKSHVLITIVLAVILIVVILVGLNNQNFVDSHVLGFQKMRLDLPNEFSQIDKSESRGGSVDTGQIDEYEEVYNYESFDEVCRLKIYAKDYSISNESAYQNHKEDYFSLNNIEAFLIQLGWSQYDGYVPSDTEYRTIKGHKWHMFTLEKSFSELKESKYYYYVYDYANTFYIIEFKHTTNYGYENDSYCSKSYNTIVKSLNFR